jgi:hypothetical protein
MIPLYGFLQGDVIGILLLVEESTSLAELALRLQQAARLRVAPKARAVVMYEGQVLDSRLTVRQANLTALERFDVVEYTV